MTTPSTSIEAKKAIQPVARTLRAQVFVELLRRGSTGATLEELELTLKLAGNTIRPRRQELEKRGLVENSGRERPTTSGRSAIVWIVPEHVAELARSKLTLTL